MPVWTSSDSNCNNFQYSVKQVDSNGIDQPNLPSVISYIDSNRTFLYIEPITNLNINTYYIVVTGTLNYYLNSELSIHFTIKHLDCSESSITPTPLNHNSFVYKVNDADPLVIPFGLFTTSLNPCILDYSVSSDIVNG